jgi:hypothetical protein
MILGPMFAVRTCVSPSLENVEVATRWIEAIDLMLSDREAGAT